MPLGRGSAPATLAPGDPPEMPVRSERCRAGGAAGSASSPPSGAAASSLVPPPPINTAQPGVATSLLYSGAKFRGQQRSKGNAYEVEVVMQVRGPPAASFPPHPVLQPRARRGGAPISSGRGRRSRPSGPLRPRSPRFIPFRTLKPRSSSLLSPQAPSLEFLTPRSPPSSPPSFSSPPGWGRCLFFPSSLRARTLLCVPSPEPQ